MSEKKKSTANKTEAKASKPSATSKDVVRNGKGDAPRNCFSDTYLKNFDSIDWSK